MTRSQRTTMSQHPIPNTDLHVSALCYGTGAFGSRVKGAEMERLFATFREAGGNFFDTAHCYAFWKAEGAGCSERALGECLRRFGGREEIVIGTKGGHPGMDGYPRPDRFLAPEVVASDLSDSLDRLGIPTIDLYYLHRDDSRVPVGEIIDSLNREIAGRRIRYLGASNWTVARIEAANAYAAAHGLHGFVASQPQWSLGEPNWQPGTDPAMRFVTDDDRAWYPKHPVAVVPYSSTSNGYFATAGESGSDYQNPTNEARRRRAQQLATELRATPNQIALAYLMCQEFLVIPILGTADPEHLQDALGAARVSLTPEQVRWLREG
jgi:aryl-alcohol dehydrogenase-like predicted oxidoreductase